ncbi:lycopene cyclase domain-containing protein [Microbacterium sp. cx-55]|uniref:lycopene cyclase domain-containing protein n=1 Tax=unclassified Microbacterium TaxID=2609290 RepID=UPI001CBC4E56|nr:MULTISPECIES: lycopene cyclase domain-containing protein [unclassified Microbacterium]MBZ4485929.1 lycopene cyclase domain-containing protein [Microbacterium sp. cx-55]MCC4906890.1 lycopene cyclase domain-containing protein [Microbacterium sp. cx-59]UGB34196.1 lycopene cyclase domain-containing protein [Microbacterium sp. cx-55]
MPGAYLLAILLSTAGVAALDARFRLALWRDRRRTLVAVLIGTAFFLVWDAFGIATGVFVKGDSPLLIGVQLAPELPLEEPFFLAFLCYLALVVSGAALRPARHESDAAARAEDAR